MADDSDGSETAMTDLVRTARLVFGGVILDDEPRLVEAIDRDRFPDDRAETALATAFTSANADLVPIVVDTEDAGGGAEAPAQDAPPIAAFDEAASAIEGSHTYYLVMNVGLGEWKRVRNAATDGTDRYRVADTVTTAATDRIGDLPEEVAGSDIDVIDWSG